MILVTGSTGFVGRALVCDLRRRDRRVLAVVRGDARQRDNELVSVGSIDESTVWTGLLEGVDSVVHCAARVHQMNDRSDQLGEYRRINTQGTLRLAEAAATAGVRRFVFLSTVKVSGDDTIPDAPFTPDTPSRPTDEYGRSKADAEEGLGALSERTGMEIVIVRPPLVYGPGAKGNIDRLVRLLRLHAPLPFGSINNRRSIVGLHNLTDFLVTVVDHPLAAGKTFVVSDADAVSTPFILRTLAQGLHRRALLLPVSPRVLQLAAKGLRAEGYLRRLTSDLEVDSTLCTTLLGWHPPQTTAASIASVVTGRSDPEMT